jgi:hypothetical protein
MRSTRRALKSLQPRKNRKILLLLSLVLKEIMYHPRRHQSNQSCPGWPPDAAGERGCDAMRCVGSSHRGEVIVAGQQQSSSGVEQQ